MESFINMTPELAYGLLVAGVRSRATNSKVMGEGLPFLRDKAR